jgi:hypothetical protein
MTQDELKKHWANRRHGIQRILARPQNYKACDGCRSISLKRAGICPICKTYRFSEDPEIVVATAHEMLTSPFPISAAIVPRLETDSTEVQFPTHNTYEKTKTPEPDSRTEETAD